MLTKRQNVLEVINGGNPDRFVNQFEAFAYVGGRPNSGARPAYGGEPASDEWGVLQQWPEGTPGPFPIHDQAHVVVKDIENWRDYVKAPNLKYPDAAWEPMIAKAEAIDRNECFVLPFMFPGIFERVHYLCEIKNTLIYFYENPDELKELLKYITDWELQLAELLCDKIHPDGCFHHDDWGTQISTFVSPAMFDEFIVPCYKQVYGYFIDRGADMIVHHSDSYAATLVPSMIEMGIKVWQGALTTNDIPALTKQFRGKIAIMGGIDSAVVDTPDWTPEIVEAETRRILDLVGKEGFIPSCTGGGVGSVYKGVYETVTATIDAVNMERYGICSSNNQSGLGQQM